MAVPKKRQSKMKTRQRKANVRPPAKGPRPPRAHAHASCPSLPTPLFPIVNATPSVTRPLPQWFAKARRQAQLAYNRAASVKYDPFEDPKYSTTVGDADDDDDDETPANE